MYDSSPPVRIHSEQRTIEVGTTGSSSTVVWNPGPTGAARLTDFADDEWTSMICVEPANVLQNAITVPPGHNHVMTVQICLD